MKQFIKSILIFSTVAVLAACSSTPENQNNSEKLAASLAVKSAMNAAFSALGTLDDADYGPSINTTSDESLDPVIVVRRRGIERSHKIISLDVDLTTDPPTGTAEVELTVKGVAVLWKVYPDGSAEREKVGEKNIDMQGTRTVNLNKIDGKWVVISVEAHALSQGADAATVSSWSVTPDPLIAGSSDNMAEVFLNEPSNDDEFFVNARGKSLNSKGVLNDNGEAPDDVANDNRYKGYVNIKAETEPGFEIGIISALNYTKTTDLTKENGEWLYPYTDTILPVVVEIAAAGNSE